MADLFDFGQKTSEHEPRSSASGRHNHSFEWSKLEIKHLVKPVFLTLLLPACHLFPFVWKVKLSSLIESTCF